MGHATGTFRGAGAVELHYQCWRPDESIGSLAIVHGFGEHSGRYMNVVNCLTPRGWAVYGFDLRGHGRSPGRRGHINHWDEYRQDVAAFLRVVNQQAQEHPVFLMGHSLGGLIVLDYVLRAPQRLSGVIASGPALGEIGLPPVLFALSRVLSRVWPTFAMDTRLDATGVSRDSSVVQAYRDDPLVHRMGTARLGSETAAARAWVQAHARELRLPFLLIQGSADRLVDPQGARLFFERVASADKQHRVYEGAFHEVHNDVCQQQALIELAQWLIQRVGSKRYGKDSAQP